MVCKLEAFEVFNGSIVEQNAQWMICAGVHGVQAGGEGGYALVLPQNSSQGEKAIMRQPLRAAKLYCT